MAGLLLGAGGIVLVQSVDKRSAPAGMAGGPLGTIQAVTLTNGQTVFGTLKTDEPGRIVLTGTFDVRVDLNQKAGTRTVRVFIRRLALPYGPLDMAIPTDKILFTESLGSNSEVTRALANLRAPRR